MKSRKVTIYEKLGTKVESGSGVVQLTQTMANGEVRVMAFTLGEWESIINAAHASNKNQEE